MNTLDFRIERIDNNSNILIIINNSASYNLSNIVSFSHLLDVALSCAIQFIGIPETSQITNKEELVSQYPTFNSAIGVNLVIEYSVG